MSDFELKLVVGIPAFNEERSIGKVIAASARHADRVLVVNDGSKDDTALIAWSLGAVVVSHIKRMGYGVAIRDCFVWAVQHNADALITLDADGQHDPSEIPIIRNALRETNADVVIGSRRARPEGMPTYRWLGKRILDHATNVRVGEELVDSQSGFRAYSRRAIQTLSPTESGMGADSELLMRAKKTGMCIVAVPVAHRYIGLETSTYNPARHWFDVLFAVMKQVYPLHFRINRKVPHRMDRCTRKPLKDILHHMMENTFGPPRTRSGS